jgi:hypothetical protein
LFSCTQGITDVTLRYTSLIDNSVEAIR